MVIFSFSVTEATEPQKPQFDTHFYMVSLKSLCFLNGSVIVLNE